MPTRCPICRGPHQLAKGNPLDIERATARRLARAFQKVPSRLWRRRPKRGEWSMVEVLAHLADAEVAFAFRLRTMIAERKPLLVVWDQEAWADGLRYNRRDPRGLLAAFRALRDSNLAILRALPRPRWRLAGRHPEYGTIRVDQLVAHYAEHDLNHLRQLEETGARLRHVARARR